MELRSGYSTGQDAITGLFTDTFTASEGPAEGQRIGRFVAALMTTTPPTDLYAFTAVEGERLAGCIFLSRLRFEDDPRTVFILSPVAVAKDRQRRGVGQKLIGFGLEAQARDGVDYVLTYGDPAYYEKTGFKQITTEFAAPPLALSMPEGWLGQSLGDGDHAPLRGPSHCVPALDAPDLW